MIDSRNKTDPGQTKYLRGKLKVKEGALKSSLLIFIGYEFTE